MYHFRSPSMDKVYFRKEQGKHIEKAPHDTERFFPENESLYEAYEAIALHKNFYLEAGFIKKVMDLTIKKKADQDFKREHPHLSRFYEADYWESSSEKIVDDFIKYLNTLPKNQATKKETAAKTVEELTQIFKGILTLGKLSPDLKDVEQALKNTMQKIGIEGLEEWYKKRLKKLKKIQGVELEPKETVTLTQLKNRIRGGMTR